MKGSTIKVTMNRADYGVAVANGVANVYSSIMTVTVPAGLAYVLLNHTPFVMKFAYAGPTALPRNAEVIVGFLGSGDTLVKELYRWDYGIFDDLTVANQRNKNYRDQVAVSMPWDYVIAREDEKLILQVKGTQIIDVTLFYASGVVGNIVEFPVQKVNLA